MFPLWLLVQTIVKRKNVGPPTFTWQADKQYNQPLVAPPRSHRSKGRAHPSRPSGPRAPRQPLGAVSPRKRGRPCKQPEATSMGSNSRKKSTAPRRPGPPPPCRSPAVFSPHRCGDLAWRRASYRAAGCSIYTSPPHAPAVLLLSAVVVSLQLRDPFQNSSPCRCSSWSLESSIDPRTHGGLLLGRTCELMTRVAEGRSRGGGGEAVKGRRDASRHRRPSGGATVRRRVRAAVGATAPAPPPPPTPTLQRLLAACRRAFGGSGTVPAPEDVALVRGILGTCVHETERVAASV
jgi:hypothetical protein